MIEFEHKFFGYLLMICGNILAVFCLIDLLYLNLGGWVIGLPLSILGIMFGNAHLKIIKKEEVTQK